DGSAHAINGASADHELIDTMPEQQGHLARVGGGADGTLERCQHAGSCSPGDVKTGDRVAVARGAITTPFGPSNYRKEPDALSGHPSPLPTRGKRAIRPAPAPRPLILRPVKPGAAEPVLQGKFGVVVDAHPPLFGGVHEEQAAERPECLAAKRCL